MAELALALSLFGQAMFTVGGAAPPVDVSGGIGGRTTSSSQLRDALPGDPGVVEIAPDLAIVPANQTMLLAADGTADLSGGWILKALDRRVESGGIVIAMAPFASGHNLDLQGGFVAAPGGWTLTGAAQISGFGQVSGAVTGVATNHIAASGGALTLGDANDNRSFGGVDVVGICYDVYESGGLAGAEFLPRSRASSLDLPVGHCRQSREQLAQVPIRIKAAAPAAFHDRVKRRGRQPSPGP